MKKALLAVVALTGLASADPLRQRVIKIERVGDDVLATVAIGSDDGVDKTMGCHMLADRKRYESRCTVVRIDKRTTLIKTGPETETARRRGELSVQFDPGH